MGIMVPAIRAKMGATEYFQAVLTAEELAKTVHAAMDFREFDNFMEAERMQRTMSESRVEQEIVPYLCKSPDRFFGSIIVLVYEEKSFKFTSWKDAGLESRFRATSEMVSMSGFLEIEGGKLFALDGQHRLHALRTVLSGSGLMKHTKKPIEGEFKNDVKNDQLSVIFIRYTTTEKARRIFNKVNRYAKPTTSSTNILTSEDDGYSIIARCLVGVDDPDKFGGKNLRPLQSPFPKRPIVLFEGAQIRTGSDKLTTLQLVYDTGKIICQATDQPNMEEKKQIVRPPDEILAEAYDVCADWWETVITGIPLLSKVRANPHLIPGRQKADEAGSMMFRPKSLEVIFAGLAEAHVKSRLSIKTLVERASKANWTLSSGIWMGIMAGENGKMITKRVPLATRVMTYLLIGDRIGVTARESLAADYKDAKNESGYRANPLPNIEH